MIKEKTGRIREAFRASARTRKKALATLLSIITIFSLMVLSARPVYSYQMINSGPQNILIAVKDLYLYNTPGSLSMILTAVYSILGGITFVTAYLQLKAQGLNLKGISSVAPGFLVSGCAGCGVGIIGLMGFTGALAALPFGGNLVMLGGIALLLLYLIRTGNPETCDI